MAKRNINLEKLSSSYLFPEIKKRKLDFLARHQNAKLISLGIGDTTAPIPPHITQALIQGAAQMGTIEGYTGYGPEQGLPDLRKRIASVLYKNLVSPEDIFISDGSKCDIGRLQLLFGPQASVAIQDPAYPVYIDGNIMNGIANISYMACLPENDFFPSLDHATGSDLIYFCSPNNPTGAVATHAQLKMLVDFARTNQSIIIFDAAYANFIQSTELPKSIFEIAGAEEVAIETGSFSKIAGFTGIRLGWTVVPEKLRFEDGSSVKKDWTRVTSTIFNGASLIVQEGGKAVLDEIGLKEIQALAAHYMENASLLSEACKQRGYEVYGGDNAPYIWIRFPGRSSWGIFQEFLERLHLVTTPGAGFGPSGEGFIRLSSFGKRADILEAAARIEKNNL